MHIPSDIVNIIAEYAVDVILAFPNARIPKTPRHQDALLRLRYQHNTFPEPEIIEYIIDNVFMGRLVVTKAILFETRDVSRIVPFARHVGNVCEKRCVKDSKGRRIQYGLSAGCIMNDYAQIILGMIVEPVTARDKYLLENVHNVFHFC